MNPLSLLKDLISSLHGGEDPRHLAAGFALGAALGLTPKGNLFAVAFLLIFFALRLNKGMALMSASFFTPVGYLIDAPAHKLGLALLKADALKGLWTALYDMPVVPLTRFNNTVVLGNLVIGLALYVPLYFASLAFVGWYAKNLAPVVEKWKLIQAMKGAGWYRTYREWVR